MVLTVLAASGVAQAITPAWSDFYTQPDPRPGFEQVFSYDPASVTRHANTVRVTLRSWRPMIEEEPVMIGIWHAEVDCGRHRGVRLRNIHYGPRGGWSDQFGDVTMSVEAALVRRLCP